jgi:peptidoglycan/xylan/chitin deacetylase (PgdA/CDA1 family)
VTAMSSSFVRRAAKAAVLPAGLVTRRRAGDIVILLYHRLGPGQSEIELSPSVFEEQLRFLVERDRAMTLDEALVGGGPGGVVVTFDDGYADFHQSALTLIQRYQVPAVLYVATSLVEENGRNGRLSWTQLKEAETTGLVTIGSHTHRHVDLSAATPAEAEQELVRSKALIEDELGVPCVHFAYPFARRSSHVEPMVRKLFRSAAVDAWRTNRRSRIDPYRLGRTPILRSDSQRFFRAKVHGLLDGESQVYRALRRGPWRPP